MMDLSLQVTLKKGLLKSTLTNPLHNKQATGCENLGMKPRNFAKPGLLFYAVTVRLQWIWNNQVS